MAQSNENNAGRQSFFSDYLVSDAAVVTGANLSTTPDSLNFSCKSANRIYIYIGDADRTGSQWRRRPDGFVVNEKERIIYILEFKRVSDAGQEYVSETQKLAEAQHLAATQG